jgi:hypothetical protein
MISYEGTKAKFLVLDPGRVGSEEFFYFSRLSFDRKRP